MITVRQAARHRPVVNHEGETDYMAQCPICPSGRGHNRIRTGSGLVELERIGCEHLSEIDRKANGAMTFVFRSK